MLLKMMTDTDSIGQTPSSLERYLFVIISNFLFVTSYDDDDGICITKVIVDLEP